VGGNVSVDPLDDRIDRGVRDRQQKFPRPGAFRQTAGNDRIDSLGRRQGRDALVGLAWSSHHKKVVNAMGADWIGAHRQRGEFCGGVVAQPPADD
jgi:hypothetical protein